MPFALIPAIIGIISTIVGAATKDDGPQDLRTPEQKRESEQMPGRFEEFDAFTKKLTPLNVGSSLAPYQQGASAPARSINFLENLPGSSSGAMPGGAAPMQPPRI